MVGSKQKLRQIEPFELNRDVFDNNIPRLREVWQVNSDLLNEALQTFDTHGLSPIHLAFRLGRDEFLEVFLQKGESRHFTALTKLPPPFRWSVMDEAVIYGKRRFIKAVLKHQKREVGYILGEPLASFTWLFVNRGKEFHLGFIVQIKPAIFNRLSFKGPINLYKKGKKFRIDFRIKIEGKLHTVNFLYNSEKYDWDSYFYIVREKNVYIHKRLGQKDSDADLERQVNELIKEPVTCISPLAHNLYNVRLAVETRRGKLKFENIDGGQKSLCYQWSGVTARTYKRLEHLSPELEKKTRKIAKGWATVTDVDMGRTRGTDGTFEQYLSGNYYMGKRMQVIGCERKLSGSIAFSQEFQASLDEWFDFMRVSSDDIRDFVIALLDRIPFPLPTGFPSYMDIQVRKIPNIKVCLMIKSFDFKLPYHAHQESDFFELPSSCKLVSSANVKQIDQSLQTNSNIYKRMM